jgi:predicted Na+-dependent transporter
MLLLERVLPVAIPLTAFLLMVVVGTDLKPDDLRKVKRARRALLVGLIGQLILPVIAIGIGRFRRPSVPSRFRTV